MPVRRANQAEFSGLAPVVGQQGMMRGDMTTTRISAAAGQVPPSSGVDNRTMLAGPGTSGRPTAKQNAIDAAAGANLDTGQALGIAKTATTSKASAVGSVQRAKIKAAMPLIADVAPPSTLAKVGNAAGRAALPLALLGGASQAYNAFQQAKSDGKSGIDATLAAMESASPTAAGLSAGAMLAKIAPAVAKFAGPVGLAVTLGKAGYDAYQGYQKGGATEAVRAGADSLTFGVASKAADFVSNQIWGDKSGNGASAPTETGSTASPQPQRLTQEQGHEFQAQNAHYDASHMGAPVLADQKEPPAPFAGKRRGWSNQARIAAAQARGLENVPYGGDPSQGPEEWNMPGKDKS